MGVLIFFIILSLIILYYVFFKVVPVIEEYKFIQMEIKRSFSEHEKEKWEKKKRKLILTLIPFISYNR